MEKAATKALPLRRDEITTATYPESIQDGVPSEPEERYPSWLSAAVHTAKETVRRILDDLPDNASLEDIQYHIYVREKIERGLRDV